MTSQVSSSSCQASAAIWVWKQASRYRVEVPSDALGVGEDFRPVAVFFLGDEPRLLQQRQVDVGFEIALGPGIAVPVPGAAEVAALLDDSNALDPRLAKMGARHQAAEAAPDDENVDFVVQRGAGEAGRDVGVIDIVAEVTFDFDVLVRWPPDERDAPAPADYFSRRASGSKSRVRSAVIESIRYLPDIPRLDGA